MQCDSCRNEAVISQRYSGRRLCYRHHAADLEVKAKRSIRAHHWLVSGDHIGVIVTGDKRSGALLHFLKRLTENRRDISLSVIPADERLTSGNDRLPARKIAAFFEIACTDSDLTDSGSVLPAENRSRSSSDTAPQSLPLGRTAAPAGLTKIAAAITLEDVASGTLAMFMGGNLETLPWVVSMQSCAIPVICPFSIVPGAEVELYWDSLGYKLACGKSSRAQGIFYDRIRTMLDDYNTRHPATYHALLNLSDQLTAGNGVILAGDSISVGIHPASRSHGEGEGNGT
jgi:tRNA(Ile)-lysidine synthase TilS/MesJ